MENYQSRDEQIRAELTKDEVIRRIEEVYHQKYNPNLPNFDAWNHLLACEAVAEATPVKEDYYKEKERENENVSVNGNGNDSSKRRVNFELTPSKLKVISKLKECTYRTSPKIIAQLLEEFFINCNSEKGWWLYVAQQWAPRPINRVIDKIINLYTSGSKTIQNPAAYFTYLIKLRKRRKS